MFLTLPSNVKIAFIGGGNMAGAMIQCLLKKQVCTSDQLMIAVNTPESVQRWKEQGVVQTFQGPNALLSQAHVWILAVKPQLMKAVLDDYRPFLCLDTLVISVAAGLTMETLSSYLTGQAKQSWSQLVRAMPNTPSSIGQGVVGMYAASSVNSKNLDLAQLILSSCGYVSCLSNEGLLDAVTALSGSGSAYVFLFAQALAEGGVKLGLEPQQAHALALQTLLGASEMALQSDLDLVTLRQNVTSKKGTTEAAINYFMDQNFKGMVYHAMKAAYDRSVQIAQSFKEV